MMEKAREFVQGWTRKVLVLVGVLLVVFTVLWLTTTRDSPTYNKTKKLDKEPPNVQAFEDGELKITVDTEPKVFVPLVMKESGLLQAKREYVIAEYTPHHAALKIPPFSVRSVRSPYENKYGDFYWKKLQSNFTYELGDFSHVQYLSFVDEGAGLNNDRMALECSLVLAFLLHRTLVLPPAISNIAHVGSHDLLLYWEMEDVRKVVPIITYETLRTRLGKKIDNKWHGIEKFATQLSWDPADTIIVVPSNNTQNPVDENRMKEFATWRHNFHHLIPKRYQNMTGDQLPLNSTIIHFKTYLFGLWYAVFYFEEVKLQKECLEFMRAFLHLRSELFDLALPIIERMGGANDYNAMHIRRGDFLTVYAKFLGNYSFPYIKTRFVDSGILDRKLPIYISTDESDQESFNNMYVKPLRHLGFQVSTFAHDFKEHFHVDSHLIGTIEQIVCAHAKVFIGSKLSTFTAYIERLRGFLPFIQVEDQPYFTDQDPIPDKPVGSCKNSFDTRDCNPSWAGYWAGITWSREFPEVWTGY